MQSSGGSLWGRLSSAGFKADEIAARFFFFLFAPPPEAAGVMGVWAYGQGMDGGTDITSVPSRVPVCKGQ